jgi:hypothetical protein
VTNATAPPSLQNHLHNCPQLPDQTDCLSLVVLHTTRVASTMKPQGAAPADDRSASDKPTQLETSIKSTDMAAPLVN